MKFRNVALNAAAVLVALVFSSFWAHADSVTIPDQGSAFFVWQSSAHSGTSASGTLSLEGADNILQLNIDFNSIEGLILTGIGLDTTPELSALSDAPAGDVSAFTFFGADPGLSSSFGIALLDSNGAPTLNGGVAQGSGTVYFSLSGAQLDSILINSVNLRFTPADGSRSEVLIGSDPPVSSVPEPAGLAILGTGMVGAAGLIRRKLLVQQ